MAMLLRLRAQAADHIDQLLEFLDRTEGCCDRESDGAEPTMAEIRHAGFYYPTDNEDDEDGADHEPSLGFLEPHLTGSEGDWWFAVYSNDARQDVYQGDTDDREGGEHDGREPDVDEEPSLGWTRTGALGNGHDLEEFAS